MKNTERNRLRYRKLNAQLANATKFNKSGETDRMVEALNSAYKLASTPTVWPHEQERVLKSAKPLRTGGRHVYDTRHLDSPSFRRDLLRNVHCMYIAFP